MIDFRCGGCGIELRAEDDDVGEIVECPKCKRDVMVRLMPELASGEMSGRKQAVTAQPIPDARLTQIVKSSIEQTDLLAKLAHDVHAFYMLLVWSAVIVIIGVLLEVAHSVFQLF